MIFNISTKKYIDLLEGAEETPSDNGAQSEPEAAENSNTNDNSSESENQDSNNDDSMDLPDENQDDSGADGTGEDDFGADGESGDEFGDEGSGEDGMDDASAEEPDPNDVIKQSEEELFSNLTQIEIQMKHEELKKNFLELYESANKLIERINNINQTQNSLAIADYASNVVSEMKSLIYTYITKAYDKKSYTESAITFNRCLVVLKGIDDLLNTILEYELKDKDEEKP